MTPKLLFATSNAHKVREMRALLASFFPFAWELVGLQDIGFEMPPETGRTFAENAFFKARTAQKACALPTLADDSGFCLEALGGFPGIFSARFFRRMGRPEAAFEVLRRHMEGKNPAASFVCTLGLCLPPESPFNPSAAPYSGLFTGRLRGVFLSPARGTQGFAYDSVFQPDGESRSFGQMRLEEKNRLSHRSRAARRLRDAWRDLMEAEAGR